MYNLSIIIASTRPGRKGPAIASWALQVARQHTEFNTELIDLAETDLPMMNEPGHPRMGKYQHPHTINWSAVVEKADAFIIVTPEYNFSFPASLKNAIDYLHNEWAYKPVAFVSYGGVAAGTRAVQQLKQVVTALKMMPIPENVNIPMFFKYFDDKGNFNADEILSKSANAMIEELLKWSRAMKGMRQEILAG